MALIRGNAQQNNINQETIEQQQAEQAERPTVLQGAIRGAKHATVFLIALFLLQLVIDIFKGRVFNTFSENVGAFFGYWVLCMIFCFVVKPWFMSSVRRSESFWSHFWNQRL